MASDAQAAHSENDVSHRDLVPSPRRLGFDLVAVATWVLAVAAALHGVGVPAWLYYAVVVAGVVGYSLFVARADALAGRHR